MVDLISLMWLEFNFNYYENQHVCTAFLSGTKGGSTGDAVCDEEGSSEARVATDGVWSVVGVLVWAHNEGDLLAHLQEPPSLGISHQTHHSKQVNSPHLTSSISILHSVVLTVFYIYIYIYMRFTLQLLNHATSNYTLHRSSQFSCPVFDSRFFFLFLSIYIYFWWTS